MTKAFPRTILVSLLALGASLQLRAELNCSNSDYRGVFGAMAIGNFISAPGIPPGPTVRVGRVEVDGSGNAKIQATLSLNGLIIKEDYGGTYSVHPDCTIDVVLLIPFPGVPAPIPFKFSGAFADEGRDLAIILMEPAGSDVRILLRKQRKEDCTNRDLYGGYQLNMTGSIISRSDAPAGFFSRVGRAVFDGKGKFTAATQASYAGRISAETLSGVYAVDSSCRVTIAYTIGQLFALDSVDDPRARKFAGMLIDNGLGVNVMEADPAGASIVGTLKAQ